VRSGLNTGEGDSIGDDIIAIAVHIAAHMSVLAKPREVVVSRTVVDLFAA
jgi:class 3 adenylate cyclase